LISSPTLRRLVLVTSRVLVVHSRFLSSTLGVHSTWRLETSNIDVAVSTQANSHGGGEAHGGVRWHDQKVAQRRPAAHLLKLLDQLRDDGTRIRARLLFARCRTV